MHSIVCHLVPAKYRVKRSLDAAARIIKPHMEKHREAKREDVVKEDDALFHWMMDSGNEKQNELCEVATRQCIPDLASIHTTSLTAVNMLLISASGNCRCTCRDEGKKATKQ